MGTLRTAQTFSSSGGQEPFRAGSERLGLCDVIDPAQLDSPFTDRICRAASMPLDSLGLLETVPGDPESETSTSLTQKIIEPLHTASFSNRVNSLRTFGLKACKVAERSADSVKVVYAPFGGADPLTPFAIFGDSVTDVFAFGIESFGVSDDFITFKRRAGPTDRSGNIYSGFESIRDLQDILQRTETSGLGPVIAARVMASLAGCITGITHFELNKEGEIKVLPGIQHGAQTSAVISFSTRRPHSDELIDRRFWYLQCNIYDGMYRRDVMGREIEKRYGTGTSLFNPPDCVFEQQLKDRTIVSSNCTILPRLDTKLQEFMEGVRTSGIEDHYGLQLYDDMLRSLERRERLAQFFDKLACQALVIKAANNMWDPVDYQRGGIDGIGAVELAYKALTPAIMADAAVVSDSPTSGNSKGGRYPHPIWISPPTEIPIPPNQHFGYNAGPSGEKDASDGEFVYLGRGRDLRRGTKESSVDEQL